MGNGTGSQPEQPVLGLKYQFIQTCALLKYLRFYFLRKQKLTPRTQYHFRLLFLQCEETFPPANNSATRFYQVAADLMKSLLLFCSPFIKEKKPEVRISTEISKNLPLNGDAGILPAEVVNPGLILAFASLRLTSYLR